MQSIWAGVSIAGIKSQNIGGNCIPELRAQRPFRGLKVRQDRLKVPTYVRRACRGLLLQLSVDVRRMMQTAYTQ